MNDSDSLSAWQMLIQIPRSKFAFPDPATFTVPDEHSVPGHSILCRYYHHY